MNKKGGKINKILSKRILLTIILTFIIGILAFTVGIKRPSYYTFGAGSIDKLNSVFWFPAPIFTFDHNYTFVYKDTKSKFFAKLITLFYWMIISYIISYFVVKKGKK